MDRPALPPRQTLTPERWVDAATEQLMDHGIDQVRVDVLARKLEVTRGSFYWHFADREDLLRAVLRAWLLQTRSHRASADFRRKALWQLLPSQRRKAAR